MRPNILFIMTDQQHARMMSCAGNSYLKTPSMDSLAIEGTRFERAYCTNPVCVPSRISMATGMMPGRVGSITNGSTITSLPSQIDANSMGNIMKRAGYDTFYGGKVHMCNALNPLQAGYDEYFANKRALLPKACINFIERERSAPFFAVASFVNPHDICFSHQAKLGEEHYGVLKLYKRGQSLPDSKLPPLPDNFQIQKNEPPAIEAHLGTKSMPPAKVMRKEYSERDWRVHRWIYHRLTEQVDRHIGLILRGLKNKGLEENTVVIFTSDHGHMDASHKLGSKNVFFEESVGVPFIIKQGAGKYKGNVNSKNLISTGLDILPTICDYAGVDIPPHLVGRSCRPFCENSAVNDWRTFVAAENGYTRMIRTERFKYCSFHYPDNRESLVDLENDPGESKNIVGEPAYSDVLKQHRQLLHNWSQETSDDQASRYLRS